MPSFLVVKFDLVSRQRVIDKKSVSHEWFRKRGFNRILTRYAKSQSAGILGLAGKAVSKNRRIGDRGEPQEAASGRRPGFVLLRRQPAVLLFSNHLEQDI